MVYPSELITSEVCVKCGACCGQYVEPDTISIVLVNEFTDYSKLDMVGCTKLRIEGDNHLCSSYLDRPQVCRDYNCLEKANRLGLVLSDDDPIPSRMKLAVAKVHGIVISLPLHPTRDDIS